MSKSNKSACSSFQTKAPCEKVQQAFSVRKSTQGVLGYELNKFPLQKGTVNSYEPHPFSVTIENEKFYLSDRSDSILLKNVVAWDLLDLGVELY